MDSSSLYQLCKEIDQKYCSKMITDPRSLEDLRGDTRMWYDTITSSLKCSETDLNAETFNSKKVTKLVMGDWLETACDLLDRSETVIQHLLRVLYLSKLDLIDSQKSVIKLQEELKSKKPDKENEEDRTHSIQTVVKRTIQEEMRSYSDVVATRCQTAPAPTSIQCAVKEVIEQEDRGKNLIIHGLREEPDEKLADKVLSVFQCLGEKPRIEAHRIGGVKAATGSAVTRPVKVTFTNSSSARLILSKSKNLRKHQDYISVFVNPDRTREERLQFKELLLKLRALKSNQPKLKHFIRNGAIQSELRD